MTRPVHRRLAACALGVLVLAGAALPAAAQEWPTRTVKVVVPFAPGGSADVFGRFLAQKLGDVFGQSFVVENKPGGGAVIGTDAVVKSAPDGYTLLVMSNTHTVNESLLPNKPYQLMRDLVPIAPINASDLVLVARAALPAKTLPELLQAAKDKPDGMTYASSGPGTPYHFAGELLKHMAGVKLLHVPYKGSAGARTDVLGGQVDMMFDAIPTMSEHVKSGKVKALAVSGKTRSPIMPDVPTVAEAGVPGYEATIWLGVMAPKGTPASVINRLNAEISKITANPETRKAWAAQGTAPLTMNVDAFGRYLNEDIAKWANLVKSAGIKVD
jgi:tripartite-type tricarboxylate transporter receptor subunit TctC